MTFTGLRLAFGGLCALLAFCAFAFLQGTKAGRERAGASYAILNAARADSVADSVRREVLAHLRADSLSAQALRDSASRKLSEAKRQTNAVLAKDSVYRAYADQVLRDTAATLDTLRFVVTQGLEQIGNLTIALGNERLASHAQHLTDSTTYAQSLASLKAGYATQQRADSVKAAQRDAGWKATVSLAKVDGLRRGRVEGFVVGLGLVAATVYAVK